MAFAFALVIHAIPDNWFALRAASLAGWYAFGIATAAPLAWLVRRLVPGQRSVRAAVLGAMTFDGLAIGLVPGLYGKEGEHLAAVAAVLLFAFAALVATDLAWPARSEAGATPARR